MPKSRMTEWVVVGLATSALAVGGISAFTFREPLLAAAGMEIRGGEPTIGPEVFEPPTEPPAPPENLAPPVAVPEGEPPDAEALKQKLDSLDTSTIVTPEGQAAALGYEIIDVASGEVLASRNPDQPLIPASNTKTLTAVAVMNAFHGQERFQTKVVAPDESSIVLVGGGDPLLTAEPVEAGSYPNPPSLRQLAASTAEKLKGQGLTSLQLGYDASYFEGAGWASTWPDGYRSQVTEISALWSDEGKVGGVRSRTPALAAAELFAAQLGDLGITIEGEPQPMTASGGEIASVDSLPVQMLVEQAMLHSNNSFTEVLGMQLAKATGHPTTFEGSTAAIEEQLTSLGLWADGASLDDASGLSRTNHFSAGMLAKVNLQLVRDPRLTGILDGLPVAGVTGTLHDRFGHEISAPARGVARAKTGTLSNVSSLGGTTKTADGAVVVYGIIANGQESAWGSKVWEDQIVGTLSGCGC